MRHLPLTAIPASLWRDGALRASASATKAYVDRLSDCGLGALPHSGVEANGPIGGAESEETDAHFRSRFSNSLGRSLCVTLDPREQLGSCSNEMIRHSFGEKLLLVDMPCGCGASGLIVLDAIRELRTARSLPKSPISVVYFAGDISDRARDHLLHIFSKMDADLRVSGIFVDLKLLHWDVSSMPGNAKAIDQIIGACAQDVPVLVLAANFNGALAVPELNESFKHFVSHLFSRLAPYPATLCLMEPTTSAAKIYIKPMSLFLKRVLSFLKGGEKESFLSTYFMEDMITKKTFSSGVIAKIVSGGSLK